MATEIYQEENVNVVEQSSIEFKDNNGRSKKMRKVNNKLAHTGNSNFHMGSKGVFHHNVNKTIKAVNQSMRNSRKG